MAAPTTASTMILLFHILFPSKNGSRGCCRVTLMNHSHQGRCAHFWRSFNRPFAFFLLCVCVGGGGLKVFGPMSF